jgi:DNA invertase Pin-like site-specific DNA recombinase
LTFYGYARVSTDGQTLDAQIAALKAAGAERVFSEKQSGAKTDRVALAKALAVLSEGDVLVVNEARSLGKINARPSQRPGDGL